MPSSCYALKILLKTENDSDVKTTTDEWNSSVGKILVTENVNYGWVSNFAVRDRPGFES